MKTLTISLFLLYSMSLARAETTPDPPCPESYHESQGNCVKCSIEGCKWCNTTNIICQECLDSFIQNGTQAVGDIHTTILCKLKYEDSGSTLVLIIVFIIIFILLFAGGFVLRWCLRRGNKPSKKREYEMKRKFKYEKQKAKEARNAKYRRQEIEIKTKSSKKGKSSQSSPERSPDPLLDLSSTETPTTNDSKGKYFNGYLEETNQPQFLDNIQIGEFEVQNAQSEKDSSRSQVNKQWFDDENVESISPRW